MEGPHAMRLLAFHGWSAMTGRPASRIFFVDDFSVSAYVVQVWDPRVAAPVVSLEPAETTTAPPDCWTVAFGNSYNDTERCIVAGYDNGGAYFVVHVCSCMFA
ncbi:MAG: hypothetical protein EOO65_02280 [Methanosarcinales archaeon]|nr:MAG: hypothetical protein EOO65_02280 [Methanosarcinales archaeon]